MTTEILRSSIDLFRRLPSSNIATNLDLVLGLLPELTEDILAEVDQPLQVKVDSSGKEYLSCDYNRDGDSYRSPWTNEYDPVLHDGTAPSDRSRELEVALNEAFDVYREMYYEGGNSSVYVWDLDEGFAGVVLLKKDNGANATKSGASSSWESVHTFEALERGGTTRYKLTSTVMLHMSNDLNNAAITATNDIPELVSTGEVSLGGSMTRQNELEAPYDSTSPHSIRSSHICGIGRAIEDMEMKMRNTLQEVYFSKTKDVVDSLRSTVGYGERNKMRGLQSELVGLLRMKETVVSR